MPCLVKLAEQLYERCKESLEKTGEVVPAITTVWGNAQHSQSLQWCRKLMNEHPQAPLRTVVIETLRKIAIEDKPDALCLGEDFRYLWVPAERVKHLDDDQRQFLFSQTGQALLEYGFAVQREAIHVTAQTRELFVSVLTPFRRTDTGIEYEDPIWRNVPQSDQFTDMFDCQFFV